MLRFVWNSAGTANGLAAIKNPAIRGGAFLRKSLLDSVIGRIIPHLTLTISTPIAFLAAFFVSQGMVAAGWAKIKFFSTHMRWRWVFSVEWLLAGTDYRRRQFFFISNHSCRFSVAIGFFCMTVDLTVLGQLRQVVSDDFGNCIWQ